MKTIRLVLLCLATLLAVSGLVCAQGAAVGNGAGVVAGANAQGGLAGRSDAWRYQWHKGQWWYYHPDKTWSTWNGSAWIPYAGANVDVGAMVRGYPFGNGYYGNRYYANGYRANPQFYRNAAPYYGNPYNYGYTPFGPTFGSVIGSTAIVRGAAGGVFGSGR